MIMKSPTQESSTPDMLVAPTVEGWLIEKALGSSSHALYSTEQYPIEKLCLQKIVTNGNWLQRNFNT